MLLMLFKKGITMNIVKSILPLLFILLFSGCGGWSMLGTVIRQDGHGVFDAYVTLEERIGTGFYTKVKGSNAIGTKTDRVGFFKFDNLDPSKEYKILLSKKIDNEEMLRVVPEETYNYERFRNERLVKLKVKEIAIIKGKIVEQKAKDTIVNEESNTPITKDNNSQFSPIDKVAVRLIKIDAGGKEIFIDDLQSSTDPNGDFKISEITESGNYRLEMVKPGYDIVSENINIKIGEVKNIGIINLPLSIVESIKEIEKSPIASIDQKHEFDLDNGQLTDELQQELMNIGIDLKDAKITKLGYSTWLLENYEEAYLIEKVNNVLQIRIRPLPDKSTGGIDTEPPIPGH